jgi:hypothetical protein
VNKQIIFAITGILLLAVIVYGGAKTPKTAWYNVEDWETEVCSKWAGSASPENAETETGYFAYGTASMTIQATKTWQGNQTLYEIYYYIEPYDGEQTYTLTMINEKKQIEKEIASGTIGVNAGAADYYTNYLAQDYNEVKLVHKYGTFKIPIIEKK